MKKLKHVVIFLSLLLLPVGITRYEFWDEGSTLVREMCWSADYSSSYNQDVWISMSGCGPEVQYYDYGDSMVKYMPGFKSEWSTLFLKKMGFAFVYPSERQ